MSIHGGDGVAPSENDRFFVEIWGRRVYYDTDSGWKTTATVIVTNTSKGWDLVYRFIGSSGSDRILSRLFF